MIPLISTLEKSMVSLSFIFRVVCVGLFLNIESSPRHFVSYLLFLKCKLVVLGLYVQVRKVL